MFRTFPTRAIITKSFWIDVPINRLAAQLHIRPKFETFHSADTKVLSVNGFPRSGNTSLWFLLKSAKKTNTELLSHAHDVIDLKIQLVNGSKCLVPFRNPIETIASLAVYRSTENDDRAIRTYLKSWILWHSMSLKLLSYSNLHFVEFNEITKDLGSILNWSSLDSFINHSFIYNEDEFRANMEKELSTHDGQGYNSNGTQPFRTISMPNISRDAILEELKSKITNDDKLSELRAEATSIYQSLVDQINR
jgi:hypothetical protein